MTHVGGGRGNWIGAVWSREQSINFWWRSGLLPYHDSDPGIFENDSIAISIDNQE